MPKYFLFIDDIKQGYPSAMTPDYGIPDTTDIVCVTAPNAFAAESEAMEAHREGRMKKNGKIYAIIPRAGKKSQ